MLFNTTYHVVEIRDSGAVIQHELKGKKRDVKKDVTAFKKEFQSLYDSLQEFINRVGVMPMRFLFFVIFTRCFMRKL